MAKVSVIVPVYKVEGYLDRCVESILDQTFSDFELILVDDGSPDNCGVICDEYAQKDSRVRVIHKENGGVSSARNAGLEAAGGEFISFVDSDDWLHPQCLQLLMQAEAEFGTDGVTINNAWVKRDDFLTEAVSYDSLTRHRLSGAQIREDLYSLVYSPQKKDWITCGLYGMYRARCFDGVRFDENIACGEDVDVIFRLNMAVESVVHLDALLYFYFTGNESAMRSGLSPAKLTVLDALMKVTQALQPRQAEMVEYRYLYCYFDFLHRVEATGDPALAEGFQRHREVFRGRYPRLRRNPHLSPAEKWMLRLYQHKIPLWRRLFGKCESRMLKTLQGFLEDTEQ